MKKLKITAIGNSDGIIMPKELLEKLYVSKGDTVTETPNRVSLFVYDSEVEKILREDRGVLRKAAECPMDCEWINKEVALTIHSHQTAEHEGLEEIQDLSLLESPLTQPPMKLACGEPPPNLCVLAACYAHGIAKNHPFLDGNKRTTFVVYRLFLRWNRIEIIASREDRYFQILSLAAGEHTEESSGAWLRPVTHDS